MAEAAHAESIRVKWKKVPAVRLFWRSFLIFVGSYTFEQIFRWSNPLLGFMNGVLHALPNGIAWVLLVLPINVLTWAFFEWGKWVRWRTLSMLAPSMGFFGYAIFYLFVQPPTAAARFETFSDSSLPQDRKNVRSRFIGGGFTDYSDNYYFETSRGEVERLIRELHMDERVVDGEKYKSQFVVMKELGYGWRDIGSWGNTREYSSSEDNRFYRLFVSEDWKRVVILFWTI